MTKEEEKNQKEVEAGAFNLEVVLALLKEGTLSHPHKLRYVSRPLPACNSSVLRVIFSTIYTHLRNGAERKCSSDPRRKDQNLAALWDAINEVYFSGVQESEFEILEQLHRDLNSEKSKDLQFDPCDSESLQDFFNKSLVCKAQKRPETKQNSEALERENFYLHFSLACQVYYPVLTANPLVADADRRLDKTTSQTSNTFGARN